MTTQEESIIKEFYKEADRECKEALALYQEHPDSKSIKERYQMSYSKYKAVFDLCCLLNITVWSDDEA